MKSVLALFCFLFAVICTAHPQPIGRFSSALDRLYGSRPYYRPGYGAVIRDPHAEIIAGAEFGAGGPIYGSYNAGFLCGVHCDAKIAACRHQCALARDSYACVVCMGPKWDACKYC